MPSDSGAAHTDVLRSNWGHTQTKYDVHEGGQHCIFCRYPRGNVAKPPRLQQLSKFDLRRNTNITGIKKRFFKLNREHIFYLNYPFKASCWQYLEHTYNLAFGQATWFQKWHLNVILFPATQELCVTPRRPPATSLFDRYRGPSRLVRWILIPALLHRVNVQLLREPPELDWPMVLTAN